MAPLLTQCPHCQTTFKVNQELLEAAQGLVRCGACLGVFAARANVVRVKSSSPHAPSFDPDTAPPKSGESDTYSITEQDPDVEMPSFSAFSGNLPDEDVEDPDTEAAEAMYEDADTTESASDSPHPPPQTSHASLEQTEERPHPLPDSEQTADYGAILHPFAYQHGHFQAGIDDDPGLSLREQRRSRQPDPGLSENSFAAHAELADDELSDSDGIALGDMQLDTDEQEDFDYADNDSTTDLSDQQILRAQARSPAGSEATGQYQEYREYENDTQLTEPEPSKQEEPDPYINRLPFIEVEEYEDDLELDGLLPEDADPDNLEINSEEFAVDSAEPAPATDPLTDSQTPATYSGQNYPVTDNQTHPTDSDSVTNPASPPQAVILDDTPDKTPALGDTRLEDDDADWQDADAFAAPFADARNNNRFARGVDEEEEDQYQDDDQDMQTRACESDDDNARPDEDGNVITNHYSDSFSAEDEFLDDDYADEDDDDSHQASIQATSEVRQRVLQPAQDTPRQASKALLNRYLQNLEDEEALDELPPETLEYVDDEPLTLASAPPARRFASTLALGFVNLALVALLGLQFIDANLEQLNRSERFTRIRPWICMVLTCPPAPQRESTTLYSQQLLVRMHPRIRDALEVSFIFVNDSPQEQRFPGLELSFRDNNDTLIANRLFTPREYLPPELRSIGQMPGQSSVQIQLDLVDPGPEALQYSIAFTDL